MRITWSVPVRGEPLSSSRGDMVRARSLIDALRQDGHDVCVVEDDAAPAAHQRVATYRSLRSVLPTAVALPVRDIGRRLHARAHAARVAAAAQTQHADLIVETQVHFADSGALAARATGIPLVLDDCSPWQEELMLGCALPVLARRAFETQTRAATRLTVSSEPLRQLLIDGGAPAHRVRVVPNAIDAARHTADNIGSAASTDRPNEPTPAARTTLVFLGSFQTWHRVDLLLEAVSRVPASLSLDVLLLGDGHARAATLDAASRLQLEDRVKALGAIPSDLVPRYLADCHVGVLPGSNDYGQPMKLLEYGAVGLPAIAPDLPPVREMIDDGINGLLFQPGDAGDLARCIRTLAADAAMRRKLGTAARARISSTGWRDSARLLLDCATAS